MANMQDMLGKTPEQMEIARLYRMADALRKQADEPTEGQMVSGHYVAPSWTQGLAKMLSAYGSGKMERDAAEAAKAYGEQQRTDFTDTAAKYAQALRGTPEQQTAYEADNPFGEDLGNLQTVTPGTPGDPNQALAIAMQSKSQPWQQFAMQNMLAQAKGANDTAEMRNWRFAQSLSEADRAAFLAKSGTMPSSVQEWEYFNKLSPEQKAAYLEMKRNPQIMNLGGTMAVRAPGGGVGESYAVTPKPEAMPTFKGAQAKAEAEAKADVAAKADSEKSARSAASDLPVIEDKANYALNLLDTMVGSEDGKVKPHKGFDNYIGTWTGEYQAKIPGSQAADFKTYHDQVKGTAFLEAFESLKGGGQITQIEGDKATAAITRMDRAQSREEYTKAARELQGIIRQGLKRARDKAKQPSGNRPPLDSLWD